LQVVKFNLVAQFYQIPSAQSNISSAQFILYVFFGSRASIPQRSYLDCWHTHLASVVNIATAATLTVDFDNLACNYDSLRAGRQGPLV